MTGFRITGARRPVSPPLGAIVTFAVVASLPSVAVAQLKPAPQTVSHIPIRPNDVDPVRAGVIDKAFGKCIYQANPTGAVKLLMHSDPVSIDLKAAGLDNLPKQFDMESCLGDQVDDDDSELGLRFAQPLLKAMLAEESYLAANRVAPTLPEGATVTVERTFVSQGDALATAQSIAAFEDCVVFEDTAGADALLRTMPGSLADRTAAVALAPTLGKCLTKGQTASLNPKSIRSFVADGLWNRFARTAAQQNNRAKPHHA